MSQAAEEGAQTGVGGLGIIQMLGLLRRRWWVIILCGLITLGGAWFLLPENQVQYQAQAVVQLDDIRRQLTAGLDGGTAEDTRNKDLLNSQVHVIQSSVVLGEVVDREGLRLIWSPELTADQVQEVSVAPDAMMGSLRLQFSPSNFIIPGTPPTAVPYGTPVEVQGVKFTIARPPAADSAVLSLIPREAAIGAVRAAIQVRPRESSSIIDIRYTDSDPVQAQRVANAVAEAFQAQDFRNVSERSRRRRQFVQEQLAVADGELAGKQRALSDYRSRSRLYNSQNRLAGEQSGLMTLEAQREALYADRRMFEALLARVEQARGEGFDDGVRTLVSAPGITSNPVVAKRFGELAQYQTERERLIASGRAPTHPDVQEVTALIASTRPELINAVRSHISSLDLQLAALDARRAQAVAAITTLPETETEETRLTEQVDNSLRVASMLRDEYQRSRIAEAADVGQVKIVDPASYARPQVSGGRRQKLAISLVLGLFLGAGGVLLLETTNTSIRRRDDVEALLGVPTMAVIPNAMQESPKPNRLLLPGGSRVLGPAAPTAVALSSFTEAYRILRANLAFSTPRGEMKTLVVTSASTGEGKTTTAANLALTFARQGTRVLLVDCDLRRPRLHRIFNAERDPGLTDLLLGRADVAEVVQPTAVDRLSLLARGRFEESAIEMLGGARMQSFLEASSDHYDLVILDTAPVLVAADTPTLSAYVDAVLLVVRAGKTERNEGRQALRQLSAVGANVIGAVLNDPDSTADRYGEYYYREYYPAEV